MRRKHDNSYLYFTGKERNGTIVLLSIIFLLILVPFFYPVIFKEKIINNEKYINHIAKLKTSKEDSFKRSYPTYNDEYEFTSSNSYKVHSPVVSGELFNFDPNTISSADWKRLGVNDKTTATIKNYLSKGGKFREPGDLKKIWGLNDQLANRLLPYVRINLPGSFKNFSDAGYIKKAFLLKKEYQPIDINDADSGSFTRLPGIGPKLSQRIINYRNKLGGFYSADQVAETFGLPDSTYRKIRSSLIIEKKVKQININTATMEEMKTHPYIRYHLANVIVQYRLQHGIYGSVSEIKNLMLINDSIYKKISPYLVAE